MQCNVIYVCLSFSLSLEQHHAIHTKLHVLFASADTLALPCDFLLQVKQKNPGPPVTFFQEELEQATCKA